MMKITFNDAKAEYDGKLMETLFPLIANVREDCEESDVAIPFEQSEFDELVARCMNYLRGELTWTKSVATCDGTLYKFLLCDIWASANETLEQHLASKDYMALLELRFEMARNVRKDGICCAFARVGNLDGLKWALSRGCSLDVQVSTAAAMAGHMEALEWLIEMGCPWESLAALSAARMGATRILEMLAARGCKFDELVAYNASLADTHGALMWLLKNGHPFNESINEFAARSGHLCVLEWLLDHGIQLGVSSFRGAAAGGHLHIIQWLFARGIQWDASVCRTAASMSHLEILQWLVANGCPCDPRDCYEESLNGSETQKWLVNTFGKKQ